MPAGLTSHWGWYWVRGFPDPGWAPKCKTQNSGLRSKEEKPRDPINQPSRCNTQEGLLTVSQTGDSDLLGGRAHRTANWASFLYAKKNILSAYYIRVTRWLVTRLQSSPIGANFAGYMFTKQSYWHKLRGLLFKFKAILPHIIKLISQLQEPTRKISDTWTIDTGKRETRYQLVKIH